MHVMASQAGGILPAIHLLQFVTARGSFWCTIKLLLQACSCRSHRECVGVGTRGEPPIDLGCQSVQPH